MRWLLQDAECAKELSDLAHCVTLGVRDRTICLGSVCHHIACGLGSYGCSSEPPRCAVHSEEHEVSCCSDAKPAGSGWVEPNAVCPTGIFVLRRPDGDNDNCNHAATYDAAVAWCADNGGRLCTEAELNAGCTRGIGCGHDADLMWTSSGGAALKGTSKGEPALRVRLARVQATSLARRPQVSRRCRRARATSTQQ
jgi:hypothetical protein